MRHSFIDNYAELDSPLQKVNPRRKIIFWIIFLLLIIFSPSWVLVACSALLIGVMFYLSKVPFGFIFKRFMEIAPFAVVIALSAVFKKDGLVIFLFLAAKAVLAVFLTLIIFSTTKFSELLMALRQLGVPGLCVNVLSFMYRYSFLLEDQLLRARRAYESRGASGKNNFTRVKILSNILGALFIRTYERAERIYLAMCARGYNHG